jgi:hypothetical protein
MLHPSLLKTETEGLQPASSQRHKAIKLRVDKRMIIFDLFFILILPD